MGFLCSPVKRDGIRASTCNPLDAYNRTRAPNSRSTIRTMQFKVHYQRETSLKGVRQEDLEERLARLQLLRHRQLRSVKNIRKSAPFPPLLNYIFSSHCSTVSLCCLPLPSHFPIAHALPSSDVIRTLRGSSSFVTKKTRKCWTKNAALVSASSSVRNFGCLGLALPVARSRLRRDLQLIRSCGTVCSLFAAAARTRADVGP